MFGILFVFLDVSILIFVLIPIDKIVKNIQTSYSAKRPKWLSAKQGTIDTFIKCIGNTMHNYVPCCTISFRNVFCILESYKEQCKMLPAKKIYLLKTERLICNYIITKSKKIFFKQISNAQQQSYSHVSLLYHRTKTTDENSAKEKLE